MVQNNIVSQTYLFNPVIDDKYENYTIVEIDKKEYALKTDKILEIIKLVELDYPEGMLSCILGIIHFKNEPVGVVDLREVFQKERIVYGLNTKIIIMQEGDVKTAIACDNVLDIKKLEKEKIHPVKYQRESEFFEGVYVLGKEDLYIINIKKITDYICENPHLYSNSKNKHYVINDENSKKVLQARKNALIELNNTVQTNISLYDSGVSFIINNVKYYINMASFKEFYKVKKSKFIKVPCTKDYVFGLINIKGEYITVIDIRRLFNNSKTTVKEKSTIIILNSDEYKIGILEDEICESITIDFDEIIQNRFQKNDDKMPEFVKDSEIYQVLDIEQLLKDERLTIC